MADVFQFDGTLQCGLGSEVSLEAMAKLLEQVNIKVGQAEKRRWPGPMIQMCGAPTGVCNVYGINDGSVDAARGIGFYVWPSADEKSREAGLRFASVPLDDRFVPFPLRSGQGQQGGDQPFPFEVGTAALSAFGKAAQHHSITELLGKKLRMYRQGDAITMDYRLDRANIVLDPKTALIVDVWFG